MTLIKSISGIRGTIGGQSGKGLTPLDVVKFTAAFAQLLPADLPKKIVIGRDARPSGTMVSGLVVSTLTAMGFDVVDLGLSTTPTVEIAVPLEKAAGGIILTASHNPVQWNALKMLNDKGEFISADLGNQILALTESEEFEFADIKNIGSSTENNTYLQKHIDQILALPLVDVSSIKEANFAIAVDGVNSSGGFAVPALLRALGVENITEIYCEPTGQFAHNPEPLTQHLQEIITTIQKGSFDLGIVVDPDVDRLAFICEDGEPFGEEYTLVAVSDYILGQNPGATVSNLSSTRALKDVSERHGQTYHSSAVGEVNVVEKMKAVSAVIGGEGNGGIIYPELHYGRDALVGIALFLTHLAKTGLSAGKLRNTYPDYYMDKNKIDLEEGTDVDAILVAIASKYKKYDVDTTDGIKITIDSSWVQLRKSNTEPIIRIYSEAESLTAAANLVEKIKTDIKEIQA